MRIILDDHEYNADLTKPIEFFRFIYLKLNNEGIKTKDGKTISLKSNSLLRTSLKVLMTPIVIPWLQYLYKEKGIILDEPEKHSDLIDYAINAFFDYIAIVEKRLDVHFTSEAIDDSRSTIKSLSATWQEPLAIEPPSTLALDTEDD